MSRRRVGATLTMVVCGFAAALVVAWNHPRSGALLAGWLGRVGVDAAARAGLERCDTEQSTLTWLAVVEQDLDLRCPAGWVGRGLGLGASPRWAAWLSRVAEDPRRSSRTRLRASLGYLAATGEAVEALPVLLEDPFVGRAERDALIAEWVTAGAPDWASPEMAREVRRRQWANGEGGDATLVADLLRWEAELGVLGPDARAAWVADALGPIGWRPDRLVEWSARQAAGLSRSEMAPAIEVLLEHGAWRCSAAGSDECLRFAADLLDAVVATEATEGDLPAPEAPPVGALTALWTLRFGDARGVAAGHRWLAEASDWVARAPGSGRPRRLLALVAHPRSAFDESRARELPLGEPMLALVLRRSSPWGSAAAAQALGSAAGVAVRVFEVGPGVVIEVDGRAVGLGPCGAAFRAPSVVGAVPWSPEDVVAQSAVMSAGDAMRQGHDSLAARFAALAASLGPSVGAGAVDVVARRLRTGHVGRAAGALLLRPPAVAEAPRWAYAAAEWQQPGRPICPSPLGP